MGRVQLGAAFIVLVLLGIGTLAYWIIPWPSDEVCARGLSFLSFVAVLAGFSFTIYQLGATERAIREANKEPALLLEVLQHLRESDGYESKDCDHLSFTPDSSDPNRVAVRCALRIRNDGTRAGSGICISFVLKHRHSQGYPETIRVGYKSDEQSYERARYCDAAVHGHAIVGWMLRFDNGLVIHPHPNDRPVVAEIDISMDVSESCEDIAIFYRIHSVEGNADLDAVVRQAKNRAALQVHPLRFLTQVV